MFMLNVLSLQTLDEHAQLHFIQNNLMDILVLLVEPGLFFHFTVPNH